MLIRLRRRRRFWAACITALFTANVLSVACHECLARERPADQQAGSPAHHHCMPDEAVTTATPDDPLYSHCQGVCDCDGLDQSTMEMRSLTADAVDQQSSAGQQYFRLADHPSPGKIDPNNQRASDRCAPERARFKPLERYCVLLN